MKTTETLLLRPPPDYWAPCQCLVLGDSIRRKTPLENLWPNQKRRERRRERFIEWKSRKAAKVIGTAYLFKNNETAAKTISTCNLVFKLWQSWELWLHSIHILENYERHAILSHGWSRAIEKKPNSPWTTKYSAKFTQTVTLIYVLLNRKVLGKR